MRRLFFNKPTILAILTIGFCVLIFQFYQIYRDANSKLAQARSRLIEQNIVKFEKIRLNPHPQKSFAQIIQNTSDTRDLTFTKTHFLPQQVVDFCKIHAKAKNKKFPVYDRDFFTGNVSSLLDVIDDVKEIEVKREAEDLYLQEEILLKI